MNLRSLSLAVLLLATVGFIVAHGFTSEHGRGPHGLSVDQTSASLYVAYASVTVYILLNLRSNILRSL